MNEKGAISGSEINKKHEEKVRKINEEWAKQAAEGVVAILWPHLKIKWKEKNNENNTRTSALPSS